MRLQNPLILTVLSLALLSSGRVVSAETGVTDKEIVLGTSSLLSGPRAFTGQQTNIGIDAAVKAVNDKGGIFGRKLRVIHEDDKYDPDRAIVCFKELMDKSVFALCGL